MKLSLVSFILGASILAPVVQNVVAESKAIFCYHESWLVYRDGDGKFDSRNIDPNLCTHISYVFLGLNANGQVKIVDPWESNEDGLNGFNNLLSLKKRNPNLKVLIYFRGWTQNTQDFSNVLVDPAKRSILVQSLIRFVQAYGFDGIDFDLICPWEADDGCEAVNKEHFNLILQDLRAACNSHGYILSATVSSSKIRIEGLYDIPTISENLDFINVMSYDFHGEFDGFVGHHSALFGSPLHAEFNFEDWNVDSTIHHWIKSGADPAKINLGIATFARTFTLADPSKSDLYASIIGGGKPGRYSKGRGLLGYNEICEEYPNATPIWDDDEDVAHLVVEDQWIGYENPQSVAIKANYGLDNKLGGFMVWSLGTDDFRGKCGDGKYPLINAIRKTIMARRYTIGD